MIERFGLGGRLALLGVVAVVLVTSVGGWVLRTNVRQALLHGMEQILAADAERIAARLHAGSDGSLWEERSTRNDAFSRIFSGWYWQAKSGADVLRSRSLWDSQLDMAAAQPLDDSNRLRSLTGPRGEALAGVRRQVAVGAQQATIDVFGPLKETQHELERLDRVLLTTQAALIAALVLALLLQVHVGLRPLRRLQQNMGQVRSSALERIGTGYGPDLDVLAHEMDRVLERNARIVARGRAHASDLSHALKKPLAVLGAAASDSHAPADTVRTQVASMGRLVDRYLSRASSGSGERQRIDVHERLQALIALMQQIHRERELNWQLQVPPQLHCSCEPTDFEEMLGNLLDNAAKWAGGRVSVQAAADGGDITMRVEDDGPGPTEQQLAQVIRRGRRFDESIEGSGFGLAIVSDIAETYAGRLELSRSPLGGLRAQLVLPA